MTSWNDRRYELPEITEDDGLQRLLLQHLRARRAREQRALGESLAAASHSTNRDPLPEMRQRVDGKSVPVERDERRSTGRSE
ncbi:MAG: hypothetical protein AAF726_21290 [Planctomycetota bacterium]